MPTITAEGPPVEDLDRKRELVRRVTEAAADYYRLPANIITVVLKENPPENVGTGGVLLVDRRRGKE